MGRPDRGAPVLSGSIIARRPGLSTGGRADRRAGRTFSAVGRWSSLGPAQVQTCNVVPRPVPGRGSRLSLGESPDAKSRGGGPPPPLGLGAAHYRSLVLAWWGAAGRSLGYFVTHVRALIWELSFAKMLFSILFLENASQIGLRISDEIAPRTDQRQRPPKTSEWQRAAIKPGVQGLAPGVLSSGFLPKKAGPPPGAGRETTSQVLTCGGPNGTTYRRQRTPAGQAAPPGPTQGKHCSQGLTSPEFVVSFKS